MAQHPQRTRGDLLQGTLDMLILQTLRRTSHHGYGIGQAIRAGSDDFFQIETGSLYPALHRLEKRGWIESEWRTSEHNQRAKYYQLTTDGTKQLTQEQSRWNERSAAITRLMNPAKSEG
jgi:transcriptional regulator